MSAQVRISPDGSAVAVRFEGRNVWAVLESEWGGSWCADNAVEDWLPMSVLPRIGGVA